MRATWWAGAAGAAAALAVVQWRLQAALPAAYMDEVFHVPQAQRYCAGDFASWDPSITTFPGLYVLSAAAHAVARRMGLAVPCDTTFLRALNLGLLGLTALTVLRLVELVHVPRRRTDVVSLAHAASVVSLPLTLFFSHLYYTDVGSLLCVLATHAAALRAAAAATQQQQQLRQAPVLLLAAFAVAFRQTNVVWVGFSCAVAALHAAAAAVATPGGSGWKGALSAAATALAPAAIVGAAFAAFVVRNGGAIVVGDAAAHAPVFHAAQLAYLLAAAGAYAAVDGAVALATFAAAGRRRVDDVHRRCAELLVAMVWHSKSSVKADARPPADAVESTGTPHRSRRSRGSRSRSSSRSRSRNSRRESASPRRIKQHPQPAAAATVEVLSRLNAHALIALTAACAACAALLHRFSYAHPYLLADNRHYTFYLWRRLLGRSATLRAALAPAYVAAGVLVVTRLLAASPPLEQAPGTGRGLGARRLLLLARLPPSAGVALLWLACSAAVVVPARLLEPRYYMVPLSMALVHMRHVSGAPWARATHCLDCRTR